MVSDLLQIAILAVQDACSRIPAFRTVPSSRLRTFSIDFALVLLSVRCAYLVDAVLPREPTEAFPRLLHIIEEQAGEQHAQVVYWYDITHDQSLFVNVPLFVRKFQDIQHDLAHSSSSWPLCVRLTEPPTLLAVVPANVMEILSFMHDAMQMSASNSSHSPSSARPPETNTFPLDLSQVILVCLVAVLIDYPVAYVPASPQQSHFLGGEPLDVYQATITLPGPVSTARLPQFHIFLKFSCPAALSAQYEELKPANMVCKLKDRFEHCLENVGVELRIQHTIETLDRVAL